MKTIIHLVFLVLLCQVGAHAQFSINISAGLNYSNLNLGFTNKIDNSTSGFGYYGSITPSFRFNKSLAVGLEIQQSMDRYNYNGFFHNASIFHFGRLIPQVNLKMIPSLGIIFGGNIGYKLIDLERINTTPFPTQVLNDMNNKYDFAAIFGVEYDIQKWYVNLRYVYGFQDLYNVATTGEVGAFFVASGVRTRIVQLGLGYRIDMSAFFGKKSKR